MSNFDQFENIEFASNPDSRCPVALVLDCSSSMVQERTGENTPPLIALDAGLDTLVSELHNDPLAKRRVEVSIITYGSMVSEPTPFATVDNLVLPQLEPMGTTSTGAALMKAMDHLEERKRTYKENGIQYYRPWIMLISDGLSTDDLSAASKRIQAAEASKSVAFFAVGVEGASLDQLSQISGKPALGLQGVKFSELFQWLSASQAAVSASNPGDAVPLPAPTGWASV